MIRGRVAAAFIGLSILMVPLGAVRAQGRLMAHRAFSNEAAKPLQIKSLRAEVHIVDGIATVEFDTLFANPYNERMEAVYALSLDRGATVTRFDLWEDGRPVSSAPSLAESAPEIQNEDEEIRHPLDTPLARVTTPTGFNARVFPIKPQSQWRVALTYHQIVPRENGHFRWTLPLPTATDTFSPTESLSVRISLRGRDPIATVATQGLVPQTPSLAGQSTFLYEAQSVTNAPLLVLNYSMATPVSLVPIAATAKPLSDATAFATTGHISGGYDYFLLQMTAPTLPAPPPDPLILLLDASASMSGDKLSWARSIAGDLTRQFARFNKPRRCDVVAFNSETRRLSLPMATALDGLRAEGGSDFQGALWQARALVGANDRDIAVVLLSDGEPTLGSRDAAQLGQALQIGPTNQSGLSRQLRFYAVGLGEAGQSTLMRALAQNNGGAAWWARSQSEANAASRSLQRSWGGATWPDVRLQLMGNRPLESYPRRRETISSGAPLWVVGRSPALPKQAVVTFSSPARSPIVRRADLPAPASQLKDAAAGAAPDVASILAALWAQGKVDYLTQAMRDSGFSVEVSEQIRELSRQYHLVNSATTSFVVDAPLDDQPRVTESGPIAPPPLPNPR